MDQRISWAVKAGMLDAPPAPVSRNQLLHWATGRPHRSVLPLSWGSRPGWSSPSSERLRAGWQEAMEGRKYRYLVVTATFRMAW